MIKNELKKIVKGENLTKNEMIDVMQKIMSGKVMEIEISAFLTAMKLKGETVDEISSAAKVMREKAETINLKNHYTVDTCGTGGDNLGTYNISTAVAFVVAACDLKVVKHGNRSISSKCGSADVLEELGVNINLSPKQTKECIEEVGIGFLFAPNYHKAMKYVMPVRRTLGFRTMFNILGPLSNPANAKAQVLGVYDKNLVEPMAQVLKNLGIKRAMVVHGVDGLDEISNTSETIVSELINGNVKNYTITPEEFDIKRGTISDIKGGDKVENAEIIRNLFNGKDEGPKLDILLLNVAATLYVGEKVKNIKEGIRIARLTLDSKKPMFVLNNMIKFTNSIAQGN